MKGNALLDLTYPTSASVAGCAERVSGDDRKVVDKVDASRDQETTLSELFNDEIDSWARRAMSANGFGGL